MNFDLSESESFSSFYSPRFADHQSPMPKSGNLAFKPTVMMPVIGGKDVAFWEEKNKNVDSGLTELEMMKERLTKLLLGEDMSGGGNGVCPALAISNAITNLAASVFGDFWRLEPLAELKKAMWRREMEWFLCVSDSIVELVPTIKQLPGGETYEIMVSSPRSDLHANLPALKKLDAMLLKILEGFRNTEFSYTHLGTYKSVGNDRDTSSSYGRHLIREEAKWWLPSPQVPENGLSENERNKLQDCRDCTNQILKAAMAINTSTLSEMDIPSAYFDSLPKSAKACLGDSIYRYLTPDQFRPDCLIQYLNLTTERQALDTVDKVEAAVHVWRKKDQKKATNTVRSFVTDGDKNLLFAQRAETLLRFLKLKFPVLRQTALDMDKIQYNKDVGHAILESYSRVIESLAFNVLARIDDVLRVDDAKRKNVAGTKSVLGGGGSTRKAVSGKTWLDTVREGS